MSRLVDLINECLEAVKKTDSTVIDHVEGLYVAVEHNCTGEEYFFQGEEYDNLINDYQKDLNEEEKDEVSFEDYLVYISQGW